MLLVQTMPLDSLSDAQNALQYAIELEHATIPPYLTALYSLKPGANRPIAKAIGAIVFQEMQHMARAANILNAINGSVRIADPGFIPSYPGGLPFHIGDRNGNELEIHLQRFSLDLVSQVFMLIEEPDHPLNFPTHTAMFALVEQTFRTIGDFYRDLHSKLKAEWFTGDHARQVSGIVDPVCTLADAQAAINLIVRQGEGTTESPREKDSGEFAHYYRFEEIARQLTLTTDNSAENGYSFGPPAILFDPAGVWPTAQDPISSLYPPGSQLRLESDLFDQTYSSLLRALHIAFNGAPNRLNAAVGLMFDLKLQAIKLTSMPLGDGRNASPCFEWKPG